MAQTTIYRQIASALEAQRSEIFLPLALPDEPTLAARYSVARETIRRSLRYLEESGAVSRKQGVGTFLQPLRPKSTSLRGKHVGIVPPWWADVPGSWYTATLYEGISRWTDANDCKFTILHVDGKPVHEHEWLARLQRNKLAGVIWIQPQERQLQLLEKTAKLFPTVVAGRAIVGRKLHNVVPNYDQAASLIDSYLAENGCDTYALVGKNITDPINQQWIDSVSKAQLKRRVKFDPIPLFFDYKNFADAQLGRLLQEFYLPQHPELKGLVFLTSGYLHWLMADESFKNRMMTDLSVATMNYGPYPIESLWPGKTITHIKCDWRNLAWRAMETLALVAENHQVAETLREEVTLVEGETVHRSRAGFASAPEH